MSYNNQLRLRINVNKFVTQIWLLENLVSYDVAVAALWNPTLQGRHGVTMAQKNFAVVSK